MKNLPPSPVPNGIWQRSAFSSLRPAILFLLLALPGWAEGQVLVQDDFNDGLGGLPDVALTLSIRLGSPFAPTVSTTEQLFLVIRDGPLS